METITRSYDVYQFKELSDSAKQSVLENLCDINVDFDWWDFVYSDANEIGCTISGFDIYRGEIDFAINDYCDIFNVTKAILENHGEQCETYKLAQQYQSDYNQKRSVFVLIGDRDEYGELDEDVFSWEIEDIDEAFKESLAKAYLSMLRKEYDYCTTDEAIIETIEANDYKFTEDGELFN